MQNRSSKGSCHSMNNNNKTPRGSLLEPQTYGMLMWQSKLQEKLVQEQNEKRQKEKDLAEQQRRIRERQEHPHQSSQFQVRGERIQNQNPPTANAETSTTSPILEIPPQMFPGPAPYTVTQQRAQTPLSPPVIQQGSNGGATSPPENLPNGPTTASSPGGLEQPMFPDIANRLRTSVSCDNFRKPPQPPPPPASTRMLGNLVSFQQMGGAGSARRSPSGKLLTVIRGDPEIRFHQKDTRGFDQTMRYLMDREKVLEYKRELDQQIEDKRKWRTRMGSGTVKEITRKGFIENGSDRADHHPDYRHHYNTPSFGSERVPGIDGGHGRGSKSGMELAPLLRKFNSLPKLAGLGLSSTDVTRPFVHSPRNEFFHPVQASEVADSLSSQLREKEWLSRRHQENERVATERHFQTWDSLWGRPGNGAPLKLHPRSLGHAVSFGNLLGAGTGAPQERGNNTGFNRVNLFKALHMTHQQPSRPK